MPPTNTIRVDRLHTATVTRLPDWHPLAGAGGYPVFAFVIRHPDGPILVDAGIGTGNAFIEDAYAPSVNPIVDCLHGVGVDERELAAIVVTHLHFDHCGQLGALSAPVFVQEAELQIASESGYTVRDWTEIPDQRLRRVRGDEDVADGIRVLSTPGHTPGHQSVLVEGGDLRDLIVGQCVFGHEEFPAGEVEVTNLHDETWRSRARASLERLRAFENARVHFSHDEAIVRPDQIT